MKTQRVEAEWIDFYSTVYGSGRPPEIERALKYAFYGGASALYFLLLRIITEGDDVTSADLDAMNEIGVELRAFALEDLMKAGPR